MNVFKASRVVGVLFALAGSPFALLGASALAFGIYDGKSWRDWDGFLLFYGFYAIGMLFTLVGLAMLAYRVVVDPQGISRTSWLGLVVHRDCWTSLKSWTTGKIKDEEFPNRFYVEFNFEGRASPIQVEPIAVAHPGFAKFVEEVRARVGTKEKVTTKEATVFTTRNES